MRSSKATLLRRLATLRSEESSILVELAELETAEPARVYSSLDLPRGVSRRVFRERCCAGLVRGAHREGRVWICSREAYHASVGRAAPALRVVAQREDDAALAAAALAAARLPPTRRTA